MAGAQKCETTVNRQRESLQSVPGVEQSDDIGREERLTVSQPNDEGPRRRVGKRAAPRCWARATSGGFVRMEKCESLTNQPD